jgi:hypothetical protein
MATETTEREDMGKTFTALVRIHEANCKLEFPSADEQNFRMAIMKKIAKHLDLAELRQAKIQGPATGLQRPKNPAA